MTNVFGIDGNSLMEPHAILLHVGCEILGNDLRQTAQPLPQLVTALGFPWWLDKSTDSPVEQRLLIVSARQSWEESLQPGATGYWVEQENLLGLLVASEWVAHGGRDSPAMHAPRTQEVADAWFCKALVYSRFAVLRSHIPQDSQTLLLAASNSLQIALRREEFVDPSWMHLREQLRQAMKRCPDTKHGNASPHVSGGVPNGHAQGQKSGIIELLALVALVAGVLWVLTAKSRNNDATSIQDHNELNHPPTVTITRCEPESSLLEGNTLTIKLNGSDEDGDYLKYEYQFADASVWLAAQRDTVTFADLKEGKLHVRFRAVDAKGLPSEPETRIWNVADNPWKQWREAAALRVLPVHERGSHNVALTRDGWNIAVSQNERCTVFRAIDGRMIRQLPSDRHEASLVAFSPDGLLVAIVDQYGKATIWDTYAGRLLQSPLFPNSRIAQLVFGPGGATLATASEDRNLRLWRLSDGKLLNAIPTPQSGVTCLAYSPNGATLALGTRDGIVQVWETSKGSLLFEVRQKAGEVKSLAFDADGKLIASGGTSGTAALFRVPDGTHVYDLSGHNGYVTCITFHNDGRTIATGSSDESVRLWRASDGRMVRALSESSADIQSLAFSADGSALIGLSSEGHVTICVRQDDSAGWLQRIRQEDLSEASPQQKLALKRRELPDPFEQPDELATPEAVPQRSTDNIAPWDEYNAAVREAIDSKISEIRRVVHGTANNASRNSPLNIQVIRLQLENQLHALGIENEHAQFGLAGWRLRQEIDSLSAERSTGSALLAKRESLQRIVSSSKEAVSIHRKATDDAKAAFVLALNNVPASQWWASVPEPFQGSREDGKFVRERIARIRNVQPNSTSFTANVNEILSRIDRIGARARVVLEENLTAATREESDFVTANEYALRNLLISLQAIDQLINAKQQAFRELRDQRAEFLNRSGNS